MSYTLVKQNPLSAGQTLSPDLFEGDAMFNPKWGVFAAGLGAFALAASYDIRLGIAAGVVMTVIVAIYLWIRLRFAFEPDHSGANRAALANRVRRLGENRREAQAREGTPKNRPDPR